ncbi:hypothetical protein OH492_28965 [Vibrio chagasii]|nr:hypothetical protein [Vibrio chagasii]
MVKLIVTKVYRGKASNHDKRSSLCNKKVQKTLPGCDLMSIVLTVCTTVGEQPPSMAIAGVVIMATLSLRKMA